jgi:hypothetical protein
VARAALTSTSRADKPRLGSSSASLRLDSHPLLTCGDLMCHQPRTTPAVTFDLRSDSTAEWEAVRAGLEGSTAYLSKLQMQSRNDAVTVGQHLKTFFRATESVYAAPGALGFQDAPGGPKPTALQRAVVGSFTLTPINKWAQQLCSWATCTEGALTQQGASKGA